MRRSIAAAVVSLATALSVVPATASSATDTTVTPSEPLAGLLAQDNARLALEHAREVLSGTAAAAPGSHSEGTLAMRDLFAAMPDLSGSERREARAVLARPTDGTNDPNYDGYTVSAKRKCKGHFCLHWVPTTSDAPPSKSWVDKTLRTMNQVWAKEVGGLNYRAPVKDGKHGGNNLFDVYLKDIGNDGLYGYCAAEYLKPGRKREASGYCVLDNDFDSSQFSGARPVDSLRVTAAHEFFHAVQFGYDYKEDPWLMEATSTWMEERFADGINDNRQYLPYGQVHLSSSSLDVSHQWTFNQYGNWAFFEYLSSHFGAGIVRRIWNAAGEFPDGGKKYSTEAVAAVLGRHGGFTDVFSRYASANTAPARNYAEGSSWPKAAIDKRWKLSRDKLRGSTKLTINHMASRNAVMKPDDSLAGKRWRGKVVVDGPGLAKSPAVRVVVTRAGGHQVEKTLRLSRSGVGRTTFGFSSGEVKRVTITAVNASTRFDCHQQTSLSCRGKAKDNASTYKLTVAAFKR
ncbi:hypothetical protein GCM10009844_40320 [Nocardioides koreensis]|uniref:Neutral metalloproteinase n=1 Tax=Nocardioides koreensis TaxID=433651 RepID=A0ABP5LVW1_9ACTN